MEILGGSGDLKAKILRELLSFNVKFPGVVRGEIHINSHLIFFKIQILRRSGYLKAKILRELLFFSVKIPGGEGRRFTVKSLFGRAFSGTSQFFNFFFYEYP